MKNGDKYPEPQVPRKRKVAGILLPALIVATLALGLFNTVTIYGAFRQQFPSQGLFSISAAFGMSGPTPNSQTLTPGSQGTFTLTVTSAASSPLTLYLSFVATNPADWAGAPIHGPTGGLLTMTVQGQQIVPENSPLLVSNGGTYYDTSEAQTYARATVTVQPQQNVFSASIAVDSSATLSDFSLDWFAGQ